MLWLYSLLLSYTCFSNEHSGENDRSLVVIYILDPV